MMAHFWNADGGKFEIVHIHMFPNHLLLHRLEIVIPTWHPNNVSSSCAEPLLLLLELQSWHTNAATYSGGTCQELCLPAGTSQLPYSPGPGGVPGYYLYSLSRHRSGWKRNSSVAFFYPVFTFWHGQSCIQNDHILEWVNISIYSLLCFNKVVMGKGNI